MLKSDLPGPFPTYRTLPLDIKNRWFRAFAQEFNWNPSITEYVRTHYNKQAAASFKANLRDWKVKWKEAGPENLPQWMKAKKKLFDGYIKMWTDEKTIKLATQYSKNRGSQRGGLGVAKHNNGAITYERRWDEMTVELGKEPDMIHFMEQTHLNKKTRTISDMKTKKILEMAAREMELVQSQRQSQTEGDEPMQPIPLTQEEMNEIMCKVVPKVRGKRYGFGNLFTEDSSMAPPRQIPKLQEEIQILKARELQKDAQIKYLMDCNKLFLAKFPDLQPPNHPASTSMEDDDETQP